MKARSTSRMARKVAIFDVDGTIFRSSLLIELVNILIDREIFPEKARSIYKNEYLSWLDRDGGYQDYILAVVKAYMKYIKGVRQKDLVDAARTVSEIHKNRVYRYTRNLTRHLKDNGYYLLAISHSPKFVLDSFGKSLGFDKIYGTRYAMDSKGKFTGEIMDEDLIFHKSKILDRA